MDQQVKHQNNQLNPKEIPVEWLQPLEQKELNQEEVVRPSLSYWQDAWQRLKKNKMAMGGLFFLVLLGIMQSLVHI